MPQLDKLIFVNQQLWLVIVFFSLYHLFLIYILPKIVILLRLRKYLITQKNTTANTSSTLTNFLKELNKLSTILYVNKIIKIST